MTNQSKEHLIRRNLEQKLSFDTLEIVNQSHLHQGHAGDDGSGESHFKIIIKSDKLSGMSRVQQHRMIYDALGQDLVKHIHALQINILS